MLLQKPFIISTEINYFHSVCSSLALSLPNYAFQSKKSFPAGFFPSLAVALAHACRVDLAVSRVLHFNSA